MSQAKPPAWFKNTYFWIAAFLLIAGIVGLPFISGEKAIRDPGQKAEAPGLLPWIYIVAAVVMLVNGLISHAQTVKLWEEEREEKGDSAEAKKEPETGEESASEA